MTHDQFISRDDAEFGTLTEREYDISRAAFRAGHAMAVKEAELAAMLPVKAVAVAKPKKAAKRFTSPTIQEAAEYFHEKGHPNPADEAHAFTDHYDSNGWKVGGKGPMKCWKASVRNWMRNHKKGVFRAPEKDGMLGAGVKVSLFSDDPEVNGDMAFLAQTRARLEQQA